MASESASALVRSHHRCISGSAPYKARDVFERINETKKHLEIANTIKDYLDKTYQSDEEINDVDPCKKIRCENGGKCVVVSGTSVGVCECNYSFCGKHCKKSLEDCSRNVQETILIVHFAVLYAPEEEEEEGNEFM
ncbi:uncharacterized protein LOC127369395 [Scomber scombrus]|uniref:Uncharacterized protein LOC127369395 n=1 Tax=Scomber scombrus TaxID=13677 RepID=A0AAV1MYS2_SCOSC